MSIKTLEILNVFTTFALHKKIGTYFAYVTNNYTNIK